MKVKRPKEFAKRCSRCLSEVRLDLDEYLALKGPFVACPTCGSRIRFTSDMKLAVDDVKPYMEGGFSTVTEVIGNEIREDQ